MKASIRILLSTSLVTGALANAVACEQSDSARQVFEADAASGGNDASPGASLPPEGGASDDAGPTFDPADEPVTCTDSPCAVELVAGSQHFCARMSDGSVQCWGDSTSGATGRMHSDDTEDAGDAEPRGGATKVTVSAVIGISAGGKSTCVVDGEGRVWCWGANEAGQLGLSADPPAADREAHPTPALVATSGKAVRVDVGQQSVCAVLESGAAVCWGGNQSAQLGQTNATPILAPNPIDTNGPRFTQLRMTTLTGFGTTDSGELWSWGALAPVSGRVSSFSPDPAPVRIPKLANVSQVAAWTRDLGWEQQGQACAIAGGKLHCWGNNKAGTLCTGVPNSEGSPAVVEIHESSLPQRVTVSAGSTCVRLTDGRVQCCGDTKRGQVGETDAGAIQRTLVTVSALDGHAVQVAASDTTICALIQGGTVSCWGGNVAGQLGQGTTDGDPHPVPVSVHFE